MSNPLQRYHHILNTIAGTVHGLSLADLAQTAGLPRSSTHRLATSLKEIGYLSIDDATGNYMLGDALVQLMRSSLLQDSKLSSFTPSLNFIVGKLEETAFFARLSNRSVDLIKAVTPARKDQLYIYPGIGSRPIDKCSSSKAIMAYLEPDDALLLLDSVEACEGKMERTELIQQLRQVNEQGFAICDGEIDEGVYSVACPVFSGAAKGLYSIGVVGPSARLKSQRIEHIVNVLQSVASLAEENLLNDQALSIDKESIK
ncbi:MAG TPA: IclR family transcriptional regulator [Advenella sp.]|nr:IclR family transcriptional regulator [Advenella sp.]